MAATTISVNRWKTLHILCNWDAYIAIAPVRVWFQLVTFVACCTISLSPCFLSDLHCPLLHRSRSAKSTWSVNKCICCESQWQMLHKKMLSKLNWETMQPIKVTHFYHLFKGPKGYLIYSPHKCQGIKNPGLCLRHVDAPWCPSLCLCECLHNLSCLQVIWANKGECTTAEICIH